MTTFNGTAGNDVLPASGGVNSGNDQFFGFGGADRLSGGIGNDEIVAGLGADRLFGGAGNDRLYGGSDNDLLFGEAGFDFLDGGGGNDSLNGGLGADTMRGNFGNDVYVVDNTGDKVQEFSAGDGVDTVRSFVNFTLGNFVEHLTLLGTANRSAIGNGLANKITGNAGANLLRGLGGNDGISAGAGNDIVYGGLGNDRLTGGPGIDRLSGDAGNDLLFGGADQDRFYFLVGSGRDQIMDFQDDVDTIYIDRDFGFSSIAEVLENASSSGGDTAIDLSKTGADAPRIIIWGLDDLNKLANDLVVI